MFSVPLTYAGISRRMKRLTSTVDDRPGSPAPRTWAGLTITTGSPRASSRNATISASCLESTYGMSYATRVPHAALVGGVAFGRRSHRSGRRGVDQPVDARPQRLLQHDPRALEVQRERLRSVQPEVRRARQMEDALDAAHRPPDRVAIANVGHNGPHPEIRERSEVRLRPHGHDNLVSPGHQQAGQV